MRGLRPCPFTIYFSTNACTGIAPQEKYSLQYGEAWPQITRASGVLYSGRNIQPTSAEIWRTVLIASEKDCSSMGAYS